jgi:hypothetical protein
VIPVIVVPRETGGDITVREFAEREGVDPQRLYRWRTVIGECTAPAFVEVARPMSSVDT